VTDYLNDPAVDPFDVAKQAADYIAEQSGVPQHDILLVLGAGWRAAAEKIGTVTAEIATEQIPGFAKPAVEGQLGTTRSIRVEHEDGTVSNVLVLGSRTHYYEGKGVRPVAHGVRTAAAAGCKMVVLTTACGGLHIAWRPGQVVLIKDIINLTAASPLEGATFIDLTGLFSPRLRELARKVDPSLPEGVYAQFRGPNYETPAEVRMAGIIGADLVGMSTGLEAIAARQCGLEVLGMALVTNLAAGVSPYPLSHEEVVEAGEAAGPRISELLARTVKLASQNV